MFPLAKPPNTCGEDQGKHGYTDKSVRDPAVVPNIRVGARELRDDIDIRKVGRDDSRPDAVWDASRQARTSESESKQGVRGIEHQGISELTTGAGFGPFGCNRSRKYCILRPSFMRTNLPVIPPVGIHPSGFVPVFVLR